MIIYILKYVEKIFFLFLTKSGGDTAEESIFFSGDHNFWSLECLKSKIKIDP